MNIRIEKFQLPRASIQRDVLLSLIADYQANGERSIFLNRRKKASELGISYNSLRSSLECLRRKKLIISSDISTSWKAGGASIIISKQVLKKAKEGLFLSEGSNITRQKSDFDSAENTPVVVVGSLETFKKPTTTNRDQDLGEMLSQLEARLNLSQRFKIGARDLADAFRKCDLPLEKFAMSVEHAAFHAGSENGKTLRSPGRWIVKRVSEGYEHEPPDFESWEERQERLMVEDAQKQLDRLRALHMQRFEIEFEHHLLGLSTSDKQRVLRASEDSRIFADSPNSALAMQQLRRLFAKKTARLHLLDGTAAGAAADD